MLEHLEWSLNTDLKVFLCALLYKRVCIFLQDLVDVVKSSFEGNNKDALLALLLPKHEYEAMCLHNALKVREIGRFFRFV